MAEINGKWLLTGIGDNWNQFCKDLQAKLPQEELHTVEYSRNEDTGEYTQTLLFGNNFLQALWFMDYGTQKFTLGEQFKHKDLSGSDSLSTLTRDGNKLVHKQLYGEGDEQVEISMERVFNGDKMTCTLSFTNKDGAGESVEATFVKV